MTMLLLDEPPLVVIPRLARLVGLNESIIVQQIHYWMQTFKAANDRHHYQNGRWWVWNTHEGWQTNFPFWSTATIKRALTTLRSRGLVLTDNFNALKMDRTIWYSIDYDVLDRLLADDEARAAQAEQSAPAGPDTSPDEPATVPDDVDPSSGQNDQMVGSDCADASAQVAPMHQVNLTPAIPETTQETTQETIQPESCAAGAARAPGATAPPLQALASTGTGNGRNGHTRHGVSLAAASGLTAAEHARSGGVPWSVPGASYKPQDAPPPLRGWLPILERRHWAAGVRISDVLALADRFADQLHADLALPTAHDAGTVRDWAGGLERLLLIATPCYTIEPDDTVLRLETRRRRAEWILDYIFHQRNAGDGKFAGFSITRPGSILRVALLADQALRKIQEQECLDHDELPPLDRNPDAPRPFGPDDDAMRRAREQAEAIRRRTRGHAA